ncbi:poly-beta-hydroxybutyrate synthase [Fulvimarina pelagi HTCC2506]|uniref:Poly-beta-hydroxybutyrate synthase n=2 Tax=Fulvimarina pelagi TaxID=217511 RepID=Q0G062_9HYPH|nr:class I poly(R)-hydroxyalkanoic acid synthase [Fulvimarina pelagi]EAU40731.1 poly-beta-hydroxybutyrate synthase [Fulvimarina pelagi HTCC2506]BAT31273.1 poly-beta-hydroxybutyrate synthase [Fulvimarina pelagi]
MADKKSESKPTTKPVPFSNEYAVKDPEQFAMNMARMFEHIGKAASAWVEPREKGDHVETGPVTMAEIVETLSKVGEYWMTDPTRAIEAQTRLFAGYMTVWNNSIRRLAGESVNGEAASSTKGDKRFSDEEWNQNFFFDFLKQAYLMTTRWADELVEEANGLDDHTRHKAAFYMRQVSNALSPTNFIMTNPELYRETIQSNGQNLVKGMKMFAEDIAAGKGNLRVRQADYSAFKIGEDIALTEGKVIAQNDICQIIQYSPQTDEVFKRPIIITPPWINKFYILDLKPEKSYVNWLVEQGHTVFLISWVNPDERHAMKTWKDYIEDGIKFGLDTAEKATGEKEFNMVGYCVGGTLLSAGIGYLKAKGDTRPQTATLFATQVDFEYAGDLLVFVDEEQLKTLEATMEAKGYLDGSQMAQAFNMLRSADLIWPYFVNNYLRGKDPMPFDLLFWNADATRMPKANHLFYLRNCYLENNLSRGEMVIGDTKIDLRAVDIPIYNLATKEDHIAPAKSVYRGSKSFGGDVSYVLAGSGHIAGVVNHPSRNKYQYWTGSAPHADGTFEEWFEKAEEHPGSWWPHWSEWIAEKSGTKKVKARKPGGGKMKAIEDAPGSYVKVQA